MSSLYFYIKKDTHTAREREREESICRKPFFWFLVVPGETAEINIGCVCVCVCVCFDKSPKSPKSPTQSLPTTNHQPYMCDSAQDATRDHVVVVLTTTLYSRIVDQGLE